jgi:hypothetical protein
MGKGREPIYEEQKAVNKFVKNKKRNATKKNFRELKKS